MKHTRLTAVELDALLTAELLKELQVLHIARGVNLITGVKYITDIEEISVANPDMALFITEGVGLGGWMVSAAIRIAWERKSTALIVPDVSLSESVVELARRLDVTLLSASESIASVALDFAVALGAAQAGTMSRVHAFVAKLALAESIDDALALTSEELGGTEVNILSAPTEPAEIQVVVEIPHVAYERLYLQTSVPAREVAHAQAVLSAAAPLVGLLVTIDAQRMRHNAFPLLSLTGFLDTAVQGPQPEPRADALIKSFGWALPGTYVVCFISAPTTVHEQVMVHERWGELFPHNGIIRVEEGWLALIPVSRTDAAESIRQRIQSLIEPLSKESLRGGISEVRESLEQARDALHQAWLSSLFAANGEVLMLDEVHIGLASRSIPQTAVLQLARHFFPELMQSSHRAELVTSGLAFCNAFGSIARAAEKTGVHRNTIKSRIARLEQLGVDFSDPERALSTHLMLHAINEHSEQESEKP